MPKTRSIAEIQEELAAKKSQIAELQGRREKLIASLEDLDRQIDSLSGGAVTGPARRRKARKKVAKKKARRGRRAAKRVVKKATKKVKRAAGRTDKSLVAYIREVLAEAGDGVRAKDITAAVLKAGYPTKSKDFYGIVATTLRDKKNFSRLGRGVYKLAGK